MPLAVTYSGTRTEGIEGDSRIGRVLIQTVCRLGGRRACRKRCLLIFGRGFWRLCMRAPRIEKRLRGSASAPPASVAGARGSASKAPLVPRRSAATVGPQHIEAHQADVLAALGRDRTRRLRKCAAISPRRGSASASARSSASSPVTTSRVKKDRARLGAKPSRCRGATGAWFESQLDLDPERLIFIDETWASTNMARRYGRAPKGKRLRVGVPYGHWKTTTFIGALTLRGFIAPFVIDCAVDRLAFETYVDLPLRFSSTWN